MRMYFVVSCVMMILFMILLFDVLLNYCLLSSGL